MRSSFDYAFVQGACFLEMRGLPMAMSTPAGPRPKKGGTSLVRLNTAACGKKMLNDVIYISNSSASWFCSNKQPEQKCRSFYNSCIKDLSTWPMIQLDLSPPSRWVRWCFPDLYTSKQGLEVGSIMSGIFWFQICTCFSGNDRSVKPRQNIENRALASSFSALAFLSASSASVRCS